MGQGDLPISWLTRVSRLVIAVCGGGRESGHVRVTLLIIGSGRTAIGIFNFRAVTRVEGITRPDIRAARV